MTSTGTTPDRCIEIACKDMNPLELEKFKEGFKVIHERLAEFSSLSQLEDKIGIVAVDESGVSAGVTLRDAAYKLAQEKFSNKRVAATIAIGAEPGKFDVLFLCGTHYGIVSVPVEVLRIKEPGSENN